MARYEAIIYKLGVGDEREELGRQVYEVSDDTPVRMEVVVSNPEQDRAQAQELRLIAKALERPDLLDEAMKESTRRAMIQFLCEHADELEGRDT